MEVNNNNEINKMFGTEDNPVKPPADPALQTSPTSTSGDSPFASPPKSADGGSALASNSISGEVEFGNSIPTNFDTSFNGESQEDGEGISAEAATGNVVIGDHEGGFGFGEKRSLIRPSFIIAPLLLIVGIAVGVLGFYTYLFGFDISAETRAAQTAAEAVAETKEHIIYGDIYVNNKLTEYECIVFAMVEEEHTVFVPVVYKVIIYKNDAPTKVFTEFDPDEFDRLDKGTPEEQVEAAVMRNRHYEFVQNLDEIRDGNKHWKKIDPLFINTRINR